VTITKEAGTGGLRFNAVAVFMDCNSPLLPWDEIVGLDKLPATMTIKDTFSVEIPLATTIEEQVGVDVCGKLQVQFTNLPSFCTSTDATLTCTPTLDTQAGVHTFDIKQVALEYPLSTKSTTVTIEVISLPVPEPELVPEEIIKINSPPFFEGAP